MKADLRRQECDMRRRMKRIFKSCPNPMADLAEFKAQLAGSSFNATIGKSRWMNTTPEQQEKNEIDKFISYSDACDILSDLMGFSPEERQRYHSREKKTVINMFYRCPSTMVLMTEFIHNMTHTKEDACFPGTVVNPIPLRGHYPSIFDTELFVRTTPAQIAWPQLRKFICDFYAFCDIVGSVDDEFYEIQTQKSDIHIPSSYAMTDRHKREFSDYNQDVKFECVFEALCNYVFELQVIDLNENTPRHKAVIDESTSHPFWSTSTGVKWFNRYHRDTKRETDRVDYIGWNEVYRGLLAIFPRFDINSKLDMIMNREPQHWKPAARTYMLPVAMFMGGGSGLNIVEDSDSLERPQTSKTGINRVPSENDNNEDEDDENDEQEEGEVDSGERKQKSSMWHKFFSRKSNKSNKSESSSSQSTSDSKQPVVLYQHPEAHKVVFRKQYKSKGSACP